jgi:hypothetical protein
LESRKRGVAVWTLDLYFVGIGSPLTISDIDEEHYIKMRKQINSFRDTTKLPPSAVHSNRYVLLDISEDEFVNLDHIVHVKWRKS